MMKKAIGGYFQLELRQGEHFHKDALRLNTARNCFEYVLLSRGYKKVYIPYYTCEVMLQPLERNHIEYEFYSININLEPVEIKQLQDGEAFLYTNYYGLKQECVERLADIYGVRLIVDNAQAFYAPRIIGIDTFYSARKFFGVPDGAYQYTDCLLEMELLEDISYMRMQHLFQRIDEGAEAGYKAFKVNDECLDYQPIMQMSKLTNAMLTSIDYERIAVIRKVNYRYLHEHLSLSNKLEFVIDNKAVPMVYPYMSDDKSLRQKLIDNKIFVAQYWPNVLEWRSASDVEYAFCQHIIPLPIDQRYDRKDMEKIIDIIMK